MFQDHSLNVPLSLAPRSSLNPEEGMTNSQPPTRPPWSSRRRLRKARLRLFRHDAANSIVQNEVVDAGTHSLDVQKEANDINFVDSTRQSPRLIRVYVSRENATILSSVNTQDTASTDTSTTVVHFGGPLATLTSEISMVFSRDLLYFDQQIPLTEVFVTLALLEASFSQTTPSPIPRVALHLTQFPKHLLCPLWMSLDNPSLSHLFLVCDSEALRPLVETIQSDEWGFRPILETEAAEREPQIRELISNAFGTFAVGNAELEYSLVFDWEGRGRYRD